MQPRRGAQPGSAFKPIVYMAGLDNGFTPSTRILDAPFVIDQGAGQGKWKPANYTKKFYGPSPMRLGIEKSRNLMTVRLAQTIGMEPVAQTAERLGVVENLPRHLSMSIGAGETTLMRLTTAYAMIVNGGQGNHADADRPDSGPRWRHRVSSRPAGLRGLRATSSGDGQEPPRLAR